MPTTTGFAVPRSDVNGGRCDVLFASGRQRSDAPAAEMAAQAINRTVRQFGPRGCVDRMAQEFGDHPQVAARKMRRVRRVCRLVQVAGLDVAPRIRNRGVAIRKPATLVQQSGTPCGSCPWAEVRTVAADSVVLGVSCLVSFVLSPAVLPFHPWGLAIAVGLSVLVTAMIAPSAP